jgi:hypothetical protein
MNMDEFDIPEMNRIGSLMQDLEMDSAPILLKRAGTPVKKVKIVRKLHAVTLTTFCDGVNWKNTEGFRSPLREAPAAGVRLGSISVAKFAQAVNWKNALDGPQLLLGVTTGPVAIDGGPPATVENFLGEFGWD